jgi:hypothetical protein
MRRNRKTGGFAVTPRGKIVDYLKILPRFGSYAAVKKSKRKLLMKKGPLSIKH